jgi:hypothetical protein
MTLSLFLKLTGNYALLTGLQLTATWLCVIQFHHQGKLHEFQIICQSKYCSYQTLFYNMA